MINFKWYQFLDLSVEQLYALLAIRFNTFVIEQNCIYLDPDGKDIFALHLLGQEEDLLVAYMRVFPPTDTENFITFGRVLTSKSSRTKGYGKKLMEELLSYCNKNYPGISIKCSAQYYLKKFYEGFGFKAFSDVYKEGGIPHISMEKN